MRRMRCFRSDRGSVLAEFALVVPILLLLVFGIIDFARAFYTTNNLTSAVREAARFAAVQTALAATSWSGSTASAPPANPIANRAFTYIQSFGAASTSTFTIGVALNGGAPPNTQSITVTVSNYQFRPITPVFTLLKRGNGPISLSPQVATFRWEQAP